MYALAAKLTFHISFAESLKDKRQVRRSLTDKTRGHFNVSVAEVGAQDVHRTLILGISIVSGESAAARDYLDEIIRYMERTAGDLGAELMDCEIYNII